MASINEKLNYINETKSLIKDKLNNLGSEIDNETTFREYAEKIENLYEEWPKINDEDITITLNNTKKGKMNLQLKGNVNQFTTTGKNILPQNKYITTRTINGITYTNNEDGTFNLVGTATANTTIQIIPIGEMELEANQPYYLYSSVSYNINTFNMSVCLGDNGATKYILANGTYTPTTTPTNERLQFYIASGQSVNATNVKLMLVKGSTSPTNYEPYTGSIASPNPDYPQNIEVVTGENTITISNEDNTESQTFNINLGDLELCKKEGYQDYIYKENNKWYLHKEIESKDFTSTNMTMNYLNIYDNYRRLMITKTTIGIPTGWGSGLALCNYFKELSGSTPISIGTFNTDKDSANLLVYLPTTINTLAEAKTYMDNLTNSKIYYVLATSTTIEITNNTLIEQLNTLEQALSYNNQTNISQTNNNLPFVINATTLMKNSD